MPINLEAVRSRANQLAPALSQEPIVRANLRGTDLTATLSVILVLLGKGVTTTKAIKAYLSGRGSAHDDDTIQFVLDAFQGGDRRHHLWHTNEQGQYVSTY